MLEDATTLTRGILLKCYWNTKTECLIKVTIHSASIALLLSIVDVLLLAKMDDNFPRRSLH